MSQEEPEGILTDITYTYTFIWVIFTLSIHAVYMPRLYARIQDLMAHRSELIT